MPETAAGFGSLLAFYFYIKSLHTGRNRYAFFAGLTLAVFYFINYRIILVPFDLALLQFILCIKQKQWKPGVKRLAIFALPLLLALPVYEIFLAVLRILQIANISPYLSTFSGTAVAGQYPDISSLLTTPYVLMTTEGAPFVALIFAGCWAARKNTILGWIVLIIALQLLAGVISAEKAFRIVSPLLALVAILAAAGFGTLAEGLRPNRWLRFVPVILLLLSVWQSLLHAVEGLKFRSEMPQAVALVKNRFGEAPILTSNRPLTRLYAYPRFLRTVRNEQVADLKQFADEGYGALILDPQKYILSTASLNWNDPQLSPLVNAVSSKCTPVIIFRHYPPRLLKFFLFEHIGPTLAHTLRLLDTLDETSG